MSIFGKYADSSSCIVNELPSFCLSFFGSQKSFWKCKFHFHSILRIQPLFFFNLKQDEDNNSCLSLRLQSVLSDVILAYTILMFLYPAFCAGMTEKVSLPVELLMTLYSFLRITMKVRYANFLSFNGYCIYPLL